MFRLRDRPRFHGFTRISVLSFRTDLDRMQEDLRAAIEDTR